MTKQTIRDLIINVLDDEHGVNETTFNNIETICAENGWNDILKVVDNDDTKKELRFFIGETDAEELRTVVE